MTDIITLEESKRLLELEKTVTAGLQSWIEVGEALIEIRDSRLYRVEASTFEEYCQIKFKMSDRHARSLMSGAPVARKIGSVLPLSQRAAVELVKVSEEKRQEIFEKAAETAKGSVPTAREIKQVVEMEVMDQKPETIEQPEPAPTPSKIINKGLQYWSEAMAVLEKITPHDLSREDALKEAISYATKRLEKNK